MKKVLSFLLAAVLLVGCLTGCNQASEQSSQQTSDSSAASSNASSSSAASSSSEPAANAEVTELILYNVGDKPDDFDTVWTKVNDILTEKLNVTINYLTISWAEYSQKYPTIISSGEQIDILYCMNGTWQEYVEKGAFQDLTELAPKYAPNLYGSLTQDQIDASTMYGKLWIVPPNYLVQVINGVAVRGDLMEKYNIDDIRTGWDFVDYLEKVYAGEEGFTLFQDLHYLMAYTDSWTGVPGSGGVFYYDGSEGGDPTDVRLWWEIDDMVDHYKSIEAGYNAGVFPKDVMMTQVLSQDAFAEGTMPAAAINTGNFGGSKVWGKVQEEHPEWDIRWYYFNPDGERVYSPISNGWVIPLSAKSPELSLQAIDLMSTDEELNKLICNGIEGVHYNLTEDNEKEVIADSGYSGLGTIFWNKDYKYQVAGEWPDYNKVIDDYVSKCHVSPILGFSLDTTNIATELANIQAIASEYGKSLSYGVLPVDDTIEELKQQYEAAGSEKCREEIIRQIQEFLAAQ